MRTLRRPWRYLVLRRRGHDRRWAWKLARLTEGEWLTLAIKSESWHRRRA